MRAGRSRAGDGGGGDAFLRPHHGGGGHQPAQVHFHVPAPAALRHGGAPLGQQLPPGSLTARPAYMSRLLSFRLVVVVQYTLLEVRRDLCTGPGAEEIVESDTRIKYRTVHLDGLFHSSVTSSSTWRRNHCRACGTGVACRSTCVAQLQHLHCILAVQPAQVISGAARLLCRVHDVAEPSDELCAGHHRGLVHARPPAPPGAHRGVLAEPGSQGDSRGAC